MIRIALLHPSYKRVDMAGATLREWVNAADKPYEIEYLIGLDDTDPTVPNYQGTFPKLPEVGKLGRFEISVGNSQNSCQASFRIATLLSETTELILQGSDDTYPTPHWDTILFGLLDGTDNFVTPKVVWVNDGYWPYGTVLVHPIVNRAYYNRVGFVVCPEYTSMFADNDLTEMATRLGAIVHAPQVTFQHRHYTKGFTQFDETYARRNNPQEFEHNRQVFLRRQARNFDLG